VLHSRIHASRARLVLFPPALGLAALVFGAVSLPASAQQKSPEWFVPGPTRPAAPAAKPAPHPGPQAVQPPLAPEAFPPVGEQGQVPLQQLQVQLPPAPEVPTLPKGPPTPASVIGILSVPDVLRVSTAYQEADKELSARRKKLNEDAQKEQVALRDLGQALANERAKLSPEQIRNKERELQDRITESRRKFGERNRIIQEAGQYVLEQINRTLEQVAQQVAISRGVNLVLNRAQILGTTADFDLTPQVGEVLNKVLPTVVIPPDGISPLAMKAPAGKTDSGKATPASVPAGASTGSSAGSAASTPPAHAKPAPPASAKPAQKH